MQKTVYLLIFMCFLGLCPGFAKDDEPVVSTQGIEIDESIAKSKPSTEQKNEQKQIKNRSKKYMKVKHKTIKQDQKRTIKQKELEYLENRLEVKKQKLELLNPTTEKGEKE